MKILKLRVDNIIQQLDIDGSLKSMQKLVEGHIEIVPVKQFIMVVNEEGWLNLHFNKLATSLSYGTIVGNAFICKDDREKLVGLNELDIHLLLELMKPQLEEV